MDNALDSGSVFSDPQEKRNSKHVLRHLAALAVLACATGLAGQDASAPSGQLKPTTQGSLAPPALFRNAAVSPYAIQPGNFPGRNSNALDFGGADAFGGLYRFRGVIPGRNPVDLASLFQDPAGYGRQPRFGPNGATPYAFGKLDPRGPGRQDLRFGSNGASFMLSYREMFTARGLAAKSGLARSSAGAGTTGSNFANGMFNLSATTMYAGRPVTGSFGAGTSSTGGIPGGPKHSAPSVALKLSF